MEVSITPQSQLQPETNINSPTAYCLIASFCAIGYWMSIELLILVYVTFKRHSGLYFWSIVITTVGIILQTTGYILKAFENKTPIILVIIICKVGWILNVTGFAIVLWSRLHLVVNQHRFLKYLLIMIIVNAFLWHTPVVIFEFGLMHGKAQPYYHLMQIFERIQQTLFTLQETILSSLYIYHTVRFLNVGYPMHTRKVMWLLLCVQVLVVALDAMLTTFDYIDWFTLKCTIHPFIYAIKLKLEFIVLNQLQALVKRGHTPGLGLGSNIPISDLENKSEDQIPSPQFVASTKTGRKGSVFDRGFITKAGAATTLSLKTPGASTNGSLEQEINRLGHAKHDSGQTLHGDDLEFDLKSIVGRDGVDDIERMYLGRWDGKVEK